MQTASSSASAFGSFFGKQRPILLQRLAIEKLQPGTTSLERALGRAPTKHRQKVLPHLIFTERIGRTVVVGRKPADLTDIDLLRADHQARKLHLLQHALA
jgi:hypothetical protein